MKTYTKDELPEILRKHKLWLNLAPGGERADLSGANLSSANLSSANLSDADLSGADLAFNVFFGGSKGAPVFQTCRGFGSRNATLTLLAQGKPSEWLFFTGCFKGTREALEKAVHAKHGGTKEEANYLRAIQYLFDTASANLP